jgi:flagellar hook-basal body complex protein FliE
MSLNPVSYSNAANAYKDALRAAQNILDQTTLPGSSSSTKEVQGGNSFLDMVGGALKSAANTGYQSEQMAMRGLSGKADLSDVVVAVSNAETALNTVVAIRDRVINAYQDIIKMPI